MGTGVSVEKKALTVSKIIRILSQCNSNRQGVTHADSHRHCHSANTMIMWFECLESICDEYGQGPDCGPVPHSFDDNTLSDDTPLIFEAVHYKIDQLFRVQLQKQGHRLHGPTLLGLSIVLYRTKMLNDPRPEACAMWRLLEAASSYDELEMLVLRIATYDCESRGFAPLMKRKGLEPLRTETGANPRDWSAEDSPRLAKRPRPELSTAANTSVVDRDDSLEPPREKEKKRKKTVHC
jgi:hypothetical protein